MKPTSPCSVTCWAGKGLRPCCGVTGWGAGERPAFCRPALSCRVGCGPHHARSVPWSTAPAEAPRARRGGPRSQVQPRMRGPVSEQRVLACLSARSLLRALTSQVSACEGRDARMACRWQDFCGGWKQGIRTAWGTSPASTVQPRATAASLARPSPLECAPGE